MRGSISNRLTCDPKRLNMEANSTPTAPAPMIISDFGTLRQVQNLDVGQDEFGVGLKAGQHARLRAGGDQNVLRFERLGAFVGLDFHLAGAFDGGEAGESLDLILLHQKLDAFGVFLDDAVLALDHLRVVEHRLLDRDAFVGGVVGEAPQLGGVQQRLGRNAADMQAGAAQFGVFFNDGGFQSVLAGAHRCRVAAGAATNHNQVVCHVTPFYMARLNAPEFPGPCISLVLLTLWAS